MLGEEPTKTWGEADVKDRYDPLPDCWTNQSLTLRSTLGHAYAQLINSFSEVAQDHVNLAEGLDAQVVNALKIMEKGHEEAKKKVSAHNIPPSTTQYQTSVSASESFPKASFRQGPRLRGSHQGKPTLSHVLLLPLTPASRANRWYRFGLSVTEASD